jgi:hypothetical protein
MPISLDPPPTPEQFIARSLAIGFGICPRCLAVHADAGEEHLKSPWSITPLCIDCGEPLLLPVRREKAA